MKEAQDTLAQASFDTIFVRKYHNKPRFYELLN